MHSSDIRILTDDELHAIAGGARLGETDTDTDPGLPPDTGHTNPSPMVSAISSATDLPPSYVRGKP